MNEVTIRLDALDPALVSQSIDRAAAILRSGGLVAFPTETVYGLGASAVDAAAIARIFEAKGRPQDNPLIVHVDSLEMMERLGKLDDRGRALVRDIMPGPLTIVVPAAGPVPPIARAGLDTIGLRIPNHTVALGLIARAGPLVAPSANRSGRPSPTDADAVLDDLDGRIDAVLDAGPCAVGIESTVVDLTGADVVILRPGIVTALEIARCVGMSVNAVGELAERGEPARSPGTRYRHYAPRTPIRVVDPSDIPLDHGPRRLYLLADPATAVNIDDAARVERLTSSEFFRSLRRADSEVFDEIVVVARLEDLPPGLRDRLLRAAAG